MRRGINVRGLLAGAGTLVVVVGLTFAGVRGGYPATRPQLLSGSAWLPSAQVGQLTLLDGSSAEVAAQVQVAGRGEHLDAVQQGAHAYAVNRSTGTIRRVDGATFEVSQPATPIPLASAGLQAFAGPDALYALDSRRGVLMSADPKTLANRGPAVPLASQVNPQAAALDDAGRLWVLDPTTGDLVWIDHGQRHVRRGVTRPGAGLLVLAGGAPVVVDTANRTAALLDRESAATRTTVGLDLRPSDRIQVSGSPHSPRLYLVASRGVLDICDLTATTCATALPLGPVNGDLGPPVETGGRLFVPDYASGQVWIVDLQQSRVTAQPKILDPKTRFQLLARDGVVFFNDPDSEHAGVIRLDGGVRPIPKYDPKDPGKGVPGRSGDARAKLTGADTTDEPTPDTPPDSPPNNPPAGRTEQPRIQISVSKSTVQVGTEVAVKVTAVAGPQPTGAQWTFGDAQSATGTRTSHHWDTPGTYQVSVRATFADGRSAVASLPIQVLATAPVTAALTVRLTGTGQGQVTSQPAGIACPPTCTASFVSGDRVQLTATAAAGSTLRAWTGACTGTGTICQLTMTAPGAQTTVDFAAGPTLRVTATAGGTVTGSGINCPGTCRAGFSPGQSATLTATPRQYFTFAGWGGACSGTGTCALTMDADKNVTATFRDMAAPETCVGYNPATLQIVNLGAPGFELRSNAGRLKLLDTAQDAQNALSVARGFTQRCFIGQRTPRGCCTVDGTEYWKGGAGRAGPVSPEDCLGYNPNNLTIVQVNDANGTWWSLRDGSMWMEAYSTEAGAVRGLRMAQQHSSQCFIGRSNGRANRYAYILEYWR